MIVTQRILFLNIVCTNKRNINWRRIIWMKIRINEKKKKKIKKQLAIANKQIELQIRKNKKCKATLTSVNKELGYQNMLLKACLEGPKDIMIFSIDRDFNYLFFNDSHKRGMKCAYEKEVSLGMNFLDQITSEEDKIKVKSNFELSFNGTSHMTLGVHGTLTNKYYETFYCCLLYTSDAA